ncbi:MAG: aldo/keto reductase [Nitriliruptoraceae bacterium]|nr:aldo/keto reductase [Nitriliruptoraceae bacterium]
MRHDSLGDSGLVVSEYALGAMTFGAETPQPEAHRLLDVFAEAGGTLLDLADVYTGGESERIVGRWLADRSQRGAMVLATKARFPLTPDRGPNDQGLSPAYLHRALDASLTRLGVDHVELYQVHGWDPLVDPEIWLPALDGMVRAGKVGAIGLSNVRGYQLERIVQVSRQLGGTVPVSIQPQYNLLARDIELEVVPAALDHRIALLPWGPLGGGWLTGKYRAEQPPTGATRLGEDPDRGVEAYAKRATPRTWAILDVLRDVAARHEASMSQVALTWLTLQPGVVSTIIGARTVSQLQDNLGARDIRLTQVDLRALDVASAPPVPDYPYRLLDDMDAERVAATHGRRSRR